MTTIRNTITESLTDLGYASYIGQVGPVIEALEDREQGIIEAIEEYAAGRGLSQHEIYNILVEVGLREMPVASEPVIEAVTGEGIEQMLSQMNSTLVTLTRRLDEASRQASRHGISF